MNLDKLVNQRVTHTKMGDGQIINITKNNVTIRFNNEQVQFFSFPNTFKNNIIRFIDIDHDEVMAALERKDEPAVKVEKTEVAAEPKAQKPVEIKEKLEPVKKEIKEEVLEEIIKPITKQKAIKEDISDEPEVVIHEDIEEERPKVKERYNFDGFLTEFHDYLRNNKLFSYLVVKYVDEPAVYKELRKLVLKIILEVLDREEKPEEKGFVTLFIAMVAHKHYDGTLWPYIEQELEEIYQIKGKAEINKTIRRLITDSNFGGDDAVLIHAGIFVKFYKDYFSFMYDVYKLNFDHNLLNAPIEKVLTNTFSGLKKTLIKEDSEQIYLKLTDKTYYLAKPTKQALIISPDEMAKVMKHFLRHIDLWYHDNKYDKTEGDLHRALKLWLDIESSSISKILTSRAPYNNKITYQMNIPTKDIYLKFPVIVLKNLDTFDYRKLEVGVVEGINKELLTIDSDYRIYQRIGYYTVNIRKQLLNNPLEKHSLVISYNKYDLFTSNDKDLKEIYIFDEEGKDISNELKYEGPAYVVHDKNEKIRNAKEYNFLSYTVSYVNKKRDFKFGKKKLEVKKELELGLNGQKLFEIVAKVNGNEYDVYKTVNSFVFASEERSTDLTLAINGQERSLKDFVNEDNIYNNKVHFEVKFDKLNLTSGLYQLEIRDLRKVVVASVKFIYDQGLTLNKKIKKEPLIYDFNIESSFNIVENKKYNYDFSVENDISFTFKLDNHSVEYLILLDLPRYRYNLNEPWKLLTDLELVSNQLILTRDCEKVTVYWPGREKSDLQIIKTDDNYLIYDLTPLRTFKSRYTDAVMLVITFNNGNSEEYKLYVQPEIIGKTIISYNEEGLLVLNFDIKCFQPDKWVLEITDPFGGKKIKDLKDKKAVISDFIPFKQYEIRIKDKESVRFGVKMSDLYQEKLYFVDNEGLFGKHFKISTVSYLDKESKDVLLKLQSTAIKFVRKISNNEPNINLTSLDTNNVCYECELYHLGRNNSLSLIKYKGKLYCEILTERSSPVLEVLVEDDKGQKLGVNIRRNELRTKYRPKNTPVQYFVIDALNDLILKQ